MEGGDHRRREAWGAFLLRSAALRYTKRPPRLGCYEGNSNCRSREGIVVAEHLRLLHGRGRFLHIVHQKSCTAVGDHFPA